MGLRLSVYRIDRICVEKLTPHRISLFTYFTALHMSASVVYSDGGWNQQRGFRFAFPEEGVITAQELVTMITRDDPHSGIQPSVAMLLETELGLVDLMVKSETEFPTQQGTVFCVEIHRKAEGNTRFNEPVIMEVGCAVDGDLSFSLPSISQSSGSATSRRRGGALRPQDEPENFPSTCSGMGLRYYDIGIQAFVRVPHGGVIQKVYRPSDNNYRIALELTPLNPQTPPSSESLIRYPADDLGLSRNDSFRIERSESRQIQAANEQMERETEYLERLRKSKTGIDKDVVRAGIPETRRSQFYKTVFCLTADRINRVNGEYQKALDATFQWQGIESDSSFTPKPHLFGLDDTFSLSYFELSPVQERNFYIILSILINSHPYLFNPSVPIIVGFLLGYLPPSQIWDVLMNFFLSSRKHALVDQSGSTKGSLAVCSKQLQEMIRQKATNFHQRFKSLSHNETAAEMVLPWFNKLLCGSGFPLYFTRRVFDMFCVEGSKIYYRIVLSSLRYIDLTANRRPETDIIGLLRNCSPITSDKIITSCFGISLKRKELHNKKPSPVSDQEMSVDLSNSVVIRPKIETPSDIVTLTMHWEEIYSWVPTSTCRRRQLRKVYEKSQDGSLLSTINNKVVNKLDSDTSCLLLMYLSSDMKRCPMVGSKKTVRQNEIVGFYLSSPMSGDNSSFGFRISPVTSTVYIPEMTSACKMSKSELYLGVSSSNYFLNFSDSSIESGRSNPPEGIPKVCSGYFHVVNFEIFAFLDD